MRRAAAEMSTNERVDAKLIEDITRILRECSAAKAESEAPAETRKINQTIRDGSWWEAAEEVTRELNGDTDDDADVDEYSIELELDNRIAALDPYDDKLQREYIRDLRRLLEIRAAETREKFKAPVRRSPLEEEQLGWIIEKAMKEGAAESETMISVGSHAMDIAGSQEALEKYLEDKLQEAAGPDTTIHVKISVYQIQPENRCLYAEKTRYYDKSQFVSSLLRPVVIATIFKNILEIADEDVDI